MFVDFTPAERAHSSVIAARAGHTVLMSERVTGSSFAVTVLDTTILLVTIPFAVMSSFLATRRSRARAAREGSCAVPKRSALGHADLWRGLCREPRGRKARWARRLY